MRRRLCGNDRLERRLRGAAAKTPSLYRHDRGGDSELFRARSSARGNLPFVPERSRDVRGPRFLRGLAHHSPAALGMSGHVYHFVDETGGAHSPDLADVAEAIWQTPARHWIAKCILSRPRPDRETDRSTICGRARSVTGRKTCWRRRASWPPARPISNNGANSPTNHCGRVCVSCLAWAQRLLIV